MNLEYIAVAIVFVLIIVGLLCLYSSIVIVPQNSVVVIERFGVFNRILPPGLHFIISLIENIKRVKWTRVEMKYQHGRVNYQQQTMSMKSSCGGSSVPRNANYNTGNFENRLVYNIYRYRRIPKNEKLFQFPKTGFLTSDNMTIHISGALGTKIVNVQKAVYNIDDLYLTIYQTFMSKLRDIVSDVDLKSILNAKNTNEIKTNLIKEMSFLQDKWGVEITLFEIREIVPPPGYIEKVKILWESNQDLQLKLAQKRTQTGIEEEEIKRNSQEIHHKVEMRKLETEAENHKQITEYQNLSKLIGDKKLIAEYLQTKEWTTAWKEMVTENKNATYYVIPYESCKVLGTRIFEEKCFEK
jgi:regulator of protease activity HflC (stomatin/prohibitin superfamily)